MRPLKALLAFAVLALLALCPAVAGAQTRELDRSVYILLDTSGSMSTGDRWSSAKAAVGALLDQLEAEGGYDSGLILGEGANIVVPLGPGNTSRIRSVIAGASNSGGNPITSLNAFVDRVLPGISGRCHMIVVVTDGDDGSNPVPEALRIKAQCSRVFVIGVDLSSVSMMQNTATAGGGRFCNGQRSEQIVKCMMMVFKRFNFDEGSRSCIDENGVGGLNPAPQDSVAQRYLGRNLRDWACFDFTAVNPQMGPWNAVLFRSDFDYSGSRFARLDLRNRTVAGKLTRTDFSGANLAGANLTLAPGHDSVSLAGADLTGARIVGTARDAGCVRGLDLTGTQADPAAGRGELSLVQNIGLCDPRLPALFAPRELRSVRLAGPRPEGGALTLASPTIDEVILDQGNIAALTVTTPGAGVSNDTTLTVSNFTAPTMIFSERLFRRLDIKAARAGTELSIARTDRSFVTIANSNIGKLSLDGVLSVKVDYAEIQTMAVRQVDKLAMYAAPVRVSGQFDVYGELSMRGDTANVNNLRVCVGCAFKASGLLKFEDMTLTGSAFEGNFTINATDSSFRTSTWKASPNVKSAFTRVDISGARFESGWSAAWSLGFPKANLNARGTYFCPDCRIAIVDGDDKLDFGNAVIESAIELRNPAMRDLNLAGAKGRALWSDTRVPPGAVQLSVEDSGGVSLDRLDVTGSVAYISMLNGALECRSCRFDKSKTVFGFAKLTLDGGAGREATLDFTTVHSVRIDRGDYGKSVWPTGMTLTECDGASLSGANVASIRDTRLDRCRFDGATVGDLVKVESVGSDFSGTRFDKARIEDSSFQGGSFARAVFDQSHIVKSAFASTTFEASEFKAGFITESSFDSVRFNGPAGPAKIKEMAGVASTLSSVKFVNTDFSGLTLDYWRLQSVTFSSVSFARADLTHAKMDIMTMDDVRFDGAILDNASIDGQLTGLRFGSAKVNQLSISGELTSSSLAGVTADPLNGIFMLPRKMDGVDLRRVDLSRTILEPTGGANATVRDLDLDGAKVSCSWKSAIDASGPDAAHGVYAYAAYMLGPTSHLADGTCQAVGVQ